ncbi:MAG: hypothetical protein D8M57_06805 [Candidatus Scalindua sp. AMX11]|nr:MAG: hypothetical protein DWQ00_14375 [Candidatus Scalindua sp.]TDE65599.1 MAG: hypothetical protein D8M57_06805 [Candidatus Scalindua sp. AMX11]
MVYSSHNSFRIKSEIKLSEYAFTKIWFPIKPQTKSVLVYTSFLLSKHIMWLLGIVASHPVEEKMEMS